MLYTCETKLLLLTYYTDDELFLPSCFVNFVTVTTKLLKYCYFVSIKMLNVQEKGVFRDLPLYFKGE